MRMRRRFVHALEATASFLFSQAAKRAGEEI